MASEQSTSPSGGREPLPLHPSECECRSDARSLVLLSSALTTDYPEILSFALEAGWRVVSDLGAVQIDLGCGQLFASAGELVNYLRGVLDNPRLEALRAAWIARQRPLEEQFAALLHAGPLLALAPGESSPLLPILQQGRIESWFQPIIHAATRSLWGYECLMRGRSVEGDLIFPNQLIAWSRQENLTFMLDRICRETHLRNAGRLLAGQDVHLLLNFLPTAIYKPEFCLATTFAAARASGIPPHRIIFEVVETEQVSDLRHLRSILDHYRSKGFRVALDDLGSGYSGLTMLADLDPDIIKIDRHLIANAVHSPMHRSICASLTDLGRNHGKLVLAEGIETAEEMQLFLDLGVDLFQGYYFGRPAPLPMVP